MELKNEININRFTVNQLVKRVFIMKKYYNNIQINRALRNSRANVELEGLHVSSENDVICKRMLNGEISNDEATRLILTSYGIQ